MQFPHLNDPPFPHLNTVDVYKYQNTFDYSRWTGKPRIKLCNVLWNSNYADVPGFDSEAERDEWFDELEGMTIELETLFNKTPDGEIRVPIPYNDAYRYNYIYIDMPWQTSENQPITYEDSQRIDRWYYFIDSMEQLSPSTTSLNITLDYWTNFINTIDIPYLMLERGHAPMKQITPEQFLANPITNNEYLLADDFNFGNETVIQSSTYVPIGNGEKYVLFVAPINANNFPNSGSAYSGNATPPYYTSTSERWGNQIVVNDYEWKYGDTNYENATLPINNEIQTGILNGCECYAIEGSQAAYFFNYCAKYCVNLIHAIQAMFILDESLFTKTRSLTAFGYTLYVADRKISQADVNLSKAMFGFEDKYSEITKLYTSPYSTLEITDDNGSIFSAKIENCGRIQMHEEVSLVYPFLDYNVFFSGINGNGTMSYKWDYVQGGEENKTMWASDFSKFMMNWSIPTYTLYVSQEHEYASANYHKKYAEREGAIKDYENAVRYANTTRENTADSFATATANVGRKTAADKTNTDNTNTTLQSVRANEQARNQALMVNGNLFNEELTDLSAGKIGDDYAYAIAFSRAGLHYTENTATATVVSGAIESVTSFVSSATGSALGNSDNKGANIAAAGINSVGGFIGTAYGAYATVTNNSAYELENEDIGAGQASNNQRILRDQNTLQRDLNRSNTTENNNRDQDNTNYQKALNTLIVDTNNAMENANAAATQATETANATYNRNATQAAEDANLRWKQLRSQRDYLSARLQPPAKYSQYSGDMQPDAFQRRGVRFNVRTQSKSAIAQAGDAMLRFGYSLHRNWDMSSGFHYMKHFTFWKAEDIWINEGTGTAGNAVNVIADILLKGVTVWRNPSEIGRVSIYENI